MRIVQINEDRTDKPVVVKLIKISCSAHLPDVSATPIIAVTTANNGGRGEDISF